MPARQNASRSNVLHSGHVRSPRLLVGIAGFALAIFGLVGARALLDESGVAGFETQEGYLLPGLREKLGRVARVDILGLEGPITLSKEDRTWRMLENGGYPADGAAVDAAIRSLAELRAAYVSKAEMEPERHGVAAPGSGYGSGTQLTLRDGAGASLAQVIIGPPFSAPGTAVEPMLFARIGDDPRVWLAAGALEVAADPLVWLNRDIADIPRSQVTAVTTKAPDDQRLTIRRSPEGDLAVVEGLSPGSHIKGPGTLLSVASLMEQMRFEAVRPLVQAPNPPQSWEAAVETDRGIIYRIRLLERAADGYWGAVTASVSGAASPEAVRNADAFNDRHARWAYLLPRYVTERLATRPEDLAQ